MVSPTYASFSNHVFSKFEEDITDKIFKMIWEDRELQKEYLDLIASKGPRGRHTVNSWLGRQILDRYGLQSDGRSDSVLESHQIQSHSKLKK